MASHWWKPSVRKSVTLDKRFISSLTETLCVISAMRRRTNAVFLPHYSSFQFYSQLYRPSRRNSFGVTNLISIRKPCSGWLVTEL